MALLLSAGVASTSGRDPGISRLARLPAGPVVVNSPSVHRPAPLSGPGAVVATLVLKNGTVLPGNYLGSGVGVVAAAVEFDSANGQLYVPNSAQSNSTFPNSLIGFYGSNESISGRTPVGLSPDAVAYDASNGYLYVANGASANVSVVNPATGSVLDTVAVGQGPSSIACDPQSGYVFVANSGSDNVTVINGSNQTVVGTIGVGGHPTAVVYDRVDGNIYVAGELSSNLTVLNGTTGFAVGSVTAGAVGVTALAVDSVSGTLYATGGDIGAIYAINASADSVVANVTDTFYPVALEYDPLNGYLYAANDLAPTYGNVTVINATTYAVVGTVTVGTNPSGIAVDLTNGFVFISNSPSGTVSVLDPASVGPQEYLVSLEVAPRFSNLGANQSEVLTAAPTCTPGPCGTGVNYAWRLSNPNGSLNRTTGPSVTFLAGGLQGNETVRVDASLNGSVVAASALINISSPLRAVGITPTSAVLPQRGNATFAATPTCSPSPCPATVSYSWSLNNSLGSLNATSGSTVRFRAAAQNGTITLKVSALLDGAERVGSSNLSIVGQSFGATLSESISSGPTPLAVSFNATGIGGTAPYSFVWAFGDGLTGTGASIQHTYSAAGSYSVVLIGYDAANQTTHLTANVVAYAASSSGSGGSLAISLSGTPVTGPAPLATTLTASVTGGTAPYAFDWTFGDHSPPSGGASVRHTYGTPGIYVATVYVNDSRGHAAETGVFISVAGGAAGTNQLAVEVTVLSLQGDAPLRVQFFPAVVGGAPPYTLDWQFGDGSSNLTTQGVVGVSHVFASAGTFLPKLVVRDSSGAAATWTVAGSAHPVVVVGSPGTSTPTWPAPVTIGIALASLAAVVLILLAVVRRVPRSPGRPSERSPYQEYRRPPSKPPAAPVGSSSIDTLEEGDPEGDML